MLCLDLWGRQGGGASLQALHFSYALGAFIAPVIIHPFFAGQHLVVSNSTSPLFPSSVNDLTTTRPFFSNPSASSVGGYSDSDENLDRFPRASVLKIDDVDNNIHDVQKRGFPMTLAISDEELGNLTVLHNDTTKLEHYSLFNATTLALNITMNATNDISSKNESININDVGSLKEEMPKNFTKPAKPKPAHTGATVKDEEQTSWVHMKPPQPPKQDPTTENPDSNLGTTVSDQKITTTPGSAVDITTLNVENLTELSQHENEKSGETTPSPLTTKIAPQPVIIDASTSTIIDKEEIKAASVALQPPTPVPVLISSTSDADLSILVSSFSPANELSSNFGKMATEYSTKPFNDINPDTQFSDGTLSVPLLEPEVLDVKEPLAGINVKPSDSSVGKLEVKSDNVSNTQSAAHFLQSITHLLKKPGTYSNISDENNNKFIESIAHKFKRYGVTKIHLAFICIGIFVFINSLIFVVILCHNPREPRSKQEEGCLDHVPYSRYTFFIILFAFYMFSSEALQGAVLHLLSASPQKNGLTIFENGIDGTVLFWGLVCLVRFLCILISGCIRLKPGKLLAVATFFTTLGTICVSVGSFGKDDFLWSGIILTSIGLAPALPTSLLWMAQYMHLSHKMCALMIILTSFGNSLTHGGLAHIAANSHLYSYILVCVNLVSMMLLLMCWCVLYTSKALSSGAGGGVRRSGSGVGSVALSLDPSNDGYHLARQQEDDDGMEMSRQMMRHHSLGSQSLEEDYGMERGQHRQLRHMHDLEHEEAGQSLLID